MNYLTYDLEVFFNYFKLILYVTKNDLDMIKVQFFKRKYNNNNNNNNNNKISTTITVVFS